MFKSLWEKWMNHQKKRELFRKKVEERELNALNELDKIYTEKEVRKNILFLKQVLGNSNDIVIHPFISAYKETPAAIIYIDGLVERTIVNEQILDVLMNDFRKYRSFEVKKGKIEEIFQYQLVSMTGIKTDNQWKNIILAILSGDTALFIDGTDQVLVISTRAWEARGIEEPISERSIRGPHDGFTETLRTNTALIRRKIRDPFLRMEEMKIGLRSQTETIICYIEGLTNPELVDEVKKRLKQIDLDRVTGTAELEHLIEDNSYSFFPQVIGTERPDLVTSSLLDGQVAVLSDNSPYVLTMPATFNRFQLTSDDYYARWFYGSFIRIIRFVASVMVLTTPGLYICLTAVNPELLPTNLLISTAAGRAGVPFPVIIELLLMEFTSELLQEAGARLPQPIGQTVSIVGALVLGEAAIKAGIVSPLTIIVVAITTIVSFVIPSYSFGIALRLSRYPITIMSAFFGIYGWVASIIFVLVHLVNLKSFNVPYLAPMSPFTIGDWRDTIFVSPQKMRKMRPQYSSPKQIIRSQEHFPMKHKNDQKMKEGINQHDDHESS